MCPNVAEICGRPVVSGVNGGGRDEKNCTVVGLGVFALGRHFGMGAGECRRRGENGKRVLHSAPG